MFTRAGRKLFSLILVICFVGTLVVPAPVQADNIARTLGGAAGLAAGSMAGAALSSAVIGAAGIASMPAVVPLLISTSIVGASAWGGAKLFSKLGLKVDEVAGSKATWTILAATIGTVAALALIPATGIFLGPTGLVIKALIGGVIGGSIGALFSDQLETVATPRNIYAAAGGAVGAVVGGIPGAIAGVAGGYGVGAMLDNAFFADEGEDWDSNSRSSRDYRGSDNGRTRYVDRRNDIEDWTNNRVDRFEERYRQRPERYADVEDSYYWQNDYYDTDPDRWDEATKTQRAKGWDKSYRYNNKDSFQTYDNTDAEVEGNGDRYNNSERLARAKATWVEAVAKFEEESIDPNANRKEVAHYLENVQVTQRAYEKALREVRGY
jgi:hypothetical protein